MADRLYAHGIFAWKTTVAQHKEWEAEREMMNDIKYYWRNLRLALSQVQEQFSSDATVSAESPILLDVAQYSENSGDSIIMHYANKVFKELYPNSNLQHIPTHRHTQEVAHADKTAIKFVCGTNMLTSDMNRYCPLALPRLTLDAYRNSLCLLAVGMRAINHETKEFNTYSKRLLRYLLNSSYYHSVRDENTKQHLNQIGITNVLNTSCVTMWDLTPDFCATIPSDKSPDVVTTVTDYAKEPLADRFMLETLCRNYNNVYVWIQAEEDSNYVNWLVSSDKIHFIEHDFRSYDEFVLSHDNIDYFGTRLHAGIHCLNQRKRAMIVEVDNRAADISTDTNIPTVKREDLKTSMDALIRGSRITDMHIPLSAIKTWKAQFSPAVRNQSTKSARP